MKQRWLIGLVLLASMQAMEAQSFKFLRSIPVGGEGGWDYLSIDAKARKLYVARATKIVIVDLAENEVAVIDIKAHAVTASWPVAPGREPSGMAFDAVHHRLFVGCGNKLMAMLDSDTGKVVAKVPIGAGVDACAFDDATQLAFASCGDGTIMIAKEEALDKLAVVQTLTTERGARTMALDPATHRIYTCTAQIAPDTGPSPSPGERRRPNYVPGTFHVLAYGTK